MDAIEQLAHVVADYAAEIPMWAYLLLLVLGLPALYTYLWGNRRVKSGFLPDADLLAVVTQAMPRASRQRILASAEIVSVCRNARDYLPYNITHVYGCGPFFHDIKADGFDKVRFGSWQGQGR